MGFIFGLWLSFSRDQRHPAFRPLPNPSPTSGRGALWVAPLARLRERGLGVLEARCHERPVADEQGIGYAGGFTQKAVSVTPLLVQTPRQFCSCSPTVCQTAEA